MGRGRPRKKTQGHEWAERIEWAQMTGDEEWFVETMRNIFRTKDGLDQMLNPKLSNRNRELTVDQQQEIEDRGIVAAFYRTHAQLFGFEDYSNYEYYSRLVHGVPNVGALQLESPIDPDDAVDLAIDLAIENQHRVRDYEKRILVGIPIHSDIAEIVRTTGQNQSTPTGKSLAERLRKLSDTVRPPKDRSTKSFDSDA